MNIRKLKKVQGKKLIRRIRRPALIRAVEDALVKAVQELSAHQTPEQRQACADWVKENLRPGVGGY